MPIATLPVFVNWTVCAALVLPLVAVKLSAGGVRVPVGTAGVPTVTWALPVAPTKMPVPVESGV
jgi:hypothetical protein